MDMLIISLLNCFSLAGFRIRSGAIMGLVDNFDIWWIASQVSSKLKSMLYEKGSIGLNNYLKKNASVGFDLDS